MAPSPLMDEELEVGMPLGPLELVVTPELNREQLAALGLEATHLDGVDGPWVEPSVLARNYARLLRHHHEAQGMIHVACEFRLFRRVRAGERLRISGRIADKFVKRGRPYVVIETQTEDEQGRLVSRERNTVIARLFWEGGGGDA
ncbi:MAG TPA: hypothetical protein VIL95_05410 [Bacillota bacterium]